MSPDEFKCVGIKTRYDVFGRENLETRPDGTETTWTPSSCTSSCGWENSEYQIAKTQLQCNGTTVMRTDTAILDPFRHVTETTSPVLSGTASTIQEAYDSYGRLVSKSFPYLTGGTEYWETISYDPINRATLLQRPVSSGNSTLQSTSFVYAGRKTTTTDAMSNTKIVVNDVNGWLRKVTDGAGYAVSTAYDAAGNVLQRTDSLGHTLSSFAYGYGVGPFRTSASDADMGAWTFTVDALGEITNWTDAKSQQFSESYDALSRPLTRTEPDLFTQWTWGATATSHNVGSLQSVCTGTGASPINCTATPGYSEAETYDADGRLSQRSITIPGDAAFTYSLTYNSLTGYLNTLTYPETTSSYSLEVSYGFTIGILSSVVDISDTPNVALWTANAQNASGQITQETLGNGIVTNRTYDAVTSWLGAMTAGVGGGTGVLNNSDLYDEVGDLTQQQNNTLGLTENFYYDADYRLTESKLNSVENLGVTYDAAGNITSRTDLAGGATWTYEPARYHAVTQAGSSSYTFTYDANGNAITRFGSSIAWSSYNYPTSVTAVDVTGTENVQFSYGPDRTRWMQNYDSGSETTFYIGGLLEQVENSSLTDYRHYVYAGKEPVAILSRKSTLVNTWSYLLSDHIGSIAAITNSSGAVDVAESFSSFGARRNPTSWSGAPTSTDLNTISGLSREGFTFQTALGQSMGLNHMNGRVQDAVTGRFLSADPNIPHLDWAQSYNRYSYVVNNPLTFIDPTGFLIPTGGGGGCPSCDGPGYLGPDCSGDCAGSDTLTGALIAMEQQASINAGINAYIASIGANIAAGQAAAASATQIPSYASPPSGGADQDVTPSPYSGGQLTPTIATSAPEQLNATPQGNTMEEVIVTASAVSDQEIDNTVRTITSMFATTKEVPGVGFLDVVAYFNGLIFGVRNVIKQRARDDYNGVKELGDHQDGQHLFDNVQWDVDVDFDTAFQNWLHYGPSDRPPGPY